MSITLILSRKCLVLLGMVLIGLFAGAAGATPYQSNIVPGDTAGGPGYFIGTRFIVGSNNLTVTSEGTWNESSSSPTAATTSNIAVGIYLYTTPGGTPTDTLVPNSNLTILSGTVGSGYIASIASPAITLLAGQTYDVASGAPGGFLSTQAGSKTTYTVAPDVTLVNGIYNPSATNSALSPGTAFTLSGNNDYYIGGTFSYSVPEPASIGFAGLAALGLLSRRRGRS